ncbi:MAG: replication initiator, partial [Mycobacteriales bacterium]
AGGCTQPIRLAGQTSIANRETGEVLEHFDTADLPDKVLYRPCGTRRESQCPACAKVYKYDAHQLIAAGIRGGKGISSSVSQHPAVFVTFTAPSFGLVHSRIVRKHACNRRTGCSCVAQPCRVRRDKPRCPHGKPAWVLSSPQRQ